ncbi:hypothetical protein C7M84_024864 [Penaeus vannamei]|uniref:Neurotransmitter-gated ion-channel transmembrane domain-containing protein n=1 Tax=Penaeus vannamei TaxID=6689 RepID=A0A423TZW4_PENVA|nr:hypothetical protein C7M84_024864 [Penaeus vannamei]
MPLRLLLSCQQSARLHTFLQRERELHPLITQPTNLHIPVTFTYCKTSTLHPSLFYYPQHGITASCGVLPNGEAQPHSISSPNNLLACALRPDSQLTYRGENQHHPNTYIINHHSTYTKPTPTPYQLHNQTNGTYNISIPTTSPRLQPHTRTKLFSPETQYLATGLIHTHTLLLSGGKGSKLLRLARSHRLTPYYWAWFLCKILTIFIPTTVINIISYATFFFKWYDFQNRIMVSLTSLLVLMTLFSQVADTLPRTSYFKLVDIWFFFSIIYTFLVIMQHTVVEYFHLYEHEIRALKKSETQKKKEPDLPKGLDERSELHRFWSEAIKKTFETLQTTVRIASTTENKKETKETKEEEKKEKCPNWASKFVNKFGNIFTAVLYVVVNLVFWIVAFMQKIQETYKDYLAAISKPEIPDNVGYP